MKAIKKHGFKFVAAAGILTATFAGTTNLNTHSGRSNKCVGEERWMVKTLQDETASQIKFNSPKKITFPEILRKERTSEWSTAKNSPRLEDEFQVYTVRGTIPYVKQEADGDIHIELVDVNNPELTLVAEIPNPDCEITKKSEYKDVFRKARNEFLNKYQDKSVYSHGTFEITGVLFHDKSNHGKGGNKNGIELHPVIKIKKVK